MDQILKIREGDFQAIPVKLKRLNLAEAAARSNAGRHHSGQQ